ncbi:MAG: AMP-binding protein [Pseudomonadota bacterium]
MNAEPTRPSLGRDLERAFAAYAGRVAVECGERRLSYAELGAMVRSAARGLAARGVAPGEIVASWSPNAVEPLVTHYAAILHSAAVVHMDPEWSAAEAAACLSGACAVGLFVRAFHQGIQYPALVKTVRRECRQLRFVVTHGREPRFESLLPDGWGEFLQSGAGAPPVETDAPAVAQPRESAQRIAMFAGLHVEGTMALGPLPAHLNGHTLVIGHADQPDAVGWARSNGCARIVAGEGAHAHAAQAAVA